MSRRRRSRCRPAARRASRPDISLRSKMPARPRASSVRLAVGVPPPAGSVNLPSPDRRPLLSLRRGPRGEAAGERIAGAQEDFLQLCADVQWPVPVLLDVQRKRQSDVIACGPVAFRAVASVSELAVPAPALAEQLRMLEATQAQFQRPFGTPGSWLLDVALDLQCQCARQRRAQLTREDISVARRVRLTRDDGCSCSSSFRRSAR